MHAAMGFGYPFPKLRVHDVAKVLTNAGDRIVMAEMAVPIVECYVLVDPGEGTPGERHANILALDQAVRVELKERGYQWRMADIPPEVEKSFGRRLIKEAGWFKTRWATYAGEI